MLTMAWTSLQDGGVKIKSHQDGGGSHYTITCNGNTQNQEEALL